MIYLDNNAMTAPLRGVVDAMLPFFGADVGNPSSRHPLGRVAREAIETSRAEVAAFLGALPGEITFTASGTESVCLAFECALRGGDRRTVIRTAVEHACVLDAAEQSRRSGLEQHVVPVDRHGLPDLDALDQILQRCGPAFVSVIWVNNETGVVSPVDAIAAICRRREALLHVDGVQAIARVDVDLTRVDCDYASFAAHKFHGPLGAGISFVRTRAPRVARFSGLQESGLRGGTENTPAIVGAAEAVRRQADWRIECDRVGALRDHLEHAVLASVSGADVNGGGSARVANTTNIFFPGRSAADFVAALGRNDLCASAGAACSTGSKPSHVIEAMGFGPERANSSVRFSLGRMTHSDEIAAALEIISRVYFSLPATWGAL